MKRHGGLLVTPRIIKEEVGHWPQNILNASVLISWQGSSTTSQPRSQQSRPWNCQNCQHCRIILQAMLKADDHSDFRIWYHHNVYAEISCFAHCSSFLSYVSRSSTTFCKDISYPRYLPQKCITLLALANPLIKYRQPTQPFHKVFHFISFILSRYRLIFGNPRTQRKTSCGHRFKHRVILITGSCALYFERAVARIGQ